MKQIKLSSEYVRALIALGFAPEFASLAKILRTAVNAGAEQLYDALATSAVSLEKANALYAIAGGAGANVETSVLLDMVSEEVSFTAFPALLQKAAELGAKAMYQALSDDDKEKADALYGNFFKPPVDPLHVDGPKGDLDYDDIVDIINSHRVTQFNYSKNPRVVVDGSHIMVYRDGHPEYCFNEHGAEDAVFDGKRLSMPDAQGFPCTFEFA